jgi:hypothetical protein
LFTPDELAALNSSFRGDNDEESDRVRWQARPNVLDLLQSVHNLLCAER